MTEERLAELMVKVTDGVATAAEKEELMNHLVDRPELRKELESHMSMKAVTDGWVERLDYDLALDRNDTNRLARVERGLGASLVIIALSVLVGGGLMEALMDPTAPLWLKFGLGTLIAGTVVLVLSTLRWRSSTGKDDKYSEVIR